MDSIVGLLHHKLKFNGKKLDVAYVTPQLMASAMPTDSYVQSYYRMRASTLVEYLEMHHAGHWHIWNLQEDKELGYDPEKVCASDESASAVTRYPVRDHQPLSFSRMLKLITEMRDYIDEDPQNLVVVHCKCGKGRTGLVAVSYLMMFHGMSYERAMREFTQKRIRFGIVDGVSIKSQQRYLRYLERWVQTQHGSAVLDESSPIILSYIIMRNPRVDDFDLSVVSLSDSSGTQKSEWDITYKEKYILLRPITREPRQISADLWLTFAGCQRKGGYRLPVSYATFGFNTDFESQRNLAGFDKPKPASIGSPLVSSKASVSLSIASSQLPYTSSCICQWDEFDGVGGMPWKGLKSFDSLEIFWQKDDTGRDNLGLDPPEEECFHPPSDCNTFNNLPMAN